MTSQQPSTQITIDSTVLSKPGLDVKQWINEMLLKVAQNEGKTSVPTELHVGQLLARLQLHQQENATALEDVITQAVVRLPRAALEVERMAKEAGELAATLSETAEKGKAVVDSVPQDAVALQNLRKTKEKLSFCAKVLQKAKLLSMQLDELEAAARGSGGAGHGAGSATTGDTEFIATAVAEVHHSLRDVQAVDPSFGLAMEQRLRTLEADLQQNVERECLDLLKKQDRTTAPKLLTALRKIQRDQRVLEQYLTQVVTTLRTQLTNELRSKAGTARGGGALLPVLGQHYRTLGKVFRSEVDYLKALYRDAATPAEINAIASEWVGTLVGATTDSISAALGSTLTNEELVRCYEAAASETAKGAGSPTGGADADGVEEDPVLRRLILLTEKPYEALTSTFAAREQQEVAVVPSSLSAAGRDADASSSTSSSESGMKLSVAHIIASLGRCIAFFPQKTVGPVSETAVDVVRKGLSHLSKVVGASGGSGAEQASAVRIQRAFRQYSVFCSASKELAVLSDPQTGWLATTAARLSQSDAATAAQLLSTSTKLRDADKSAKEECIRNVCSALLTPFRRVLESYARFEIWGDPAHATQTHKPKTLAAFSSGQVAPSDLIRQFGAELMEIPMTLDAVEGEGDDAVGDDSQAWLSRVVSEVVVLLLDSIGKISIHPSASSTAGAGAASSSVVTSLPALEQLACDLEYVSNVLGAVSEQNFDSTLGTVLQKVVAKVEALKSGASNQASVIKIGELIL